MRILLVISFLLIGVGLSAQTDSTTTQGEIISGEVVIEKDNKIVLPQADKIYVRSTTITFDNQPIDINFQVKEPLFEWPDYKSDVPFQSLDEVYPIESYQNYIKAGYGNFNSPLLEAGLFRTFGQWDTQAKLDYESFKSGPVNDNNSGNAQGGIELSGTYKKESFSLTPSISFRNSQYSFYGNADRINSAFPDGNLFDASLNKFFVDLALEGGGDDIKYSVQPLVSNVSQNISPENGINKETTIGLLGSLGYKIDEKLTTGFKIEARSASYDGGIQIDRSLININPWVIHRKDNLTIAAGFMISSGKVADESKTSFYPHARLDYDLTDQWSIYGLISGGQEWNGLNLLINENQFLDDSLAIVPTEFNSQFGGGIKGSPVKNVLLEANLVYSSVEGMPFFVPSSMDSSRYTFEYDSGSVGVVTLNSSLSFMPNASSTYGVSLELNGYSMESLDRPWHKPAYIFKAFTSHNIQEKLIVSAYLTSMGGIRGPANVDFGYVKLPSFVDIGVGAKYLITQRASAFISVNNLLNNEYERYLGYPTRGITFKIGGQYRF